MDIATDRISPEVAVLALAGELDASNHRAVIDAGERLYADGVRRLVLDMRELAYMSSSGVVAIHSLVVVFQGGSLPGPDAGVEASWGMGRDATGGGMADAVRLVAPQPIVQRGLKRTGFTEVLRIYPDRAAALA